MNILPLVVAFLLVFALTATTFMKEIQTIFLLEKTVEGFHRTERIVHNNIVRKSYANISGDSLTPNEHSSSPKTEKTYLSKRKACPPSDSSKFNLRPLIEYPKELKSHPLYEPLATFLRLLYRENVFKKFKIKEIEYRLIHAWVEKAQKQPEIKEIAELYPEDPHLAKVFYKMLKGTNQYGSEGGIPPLKHFICFREEKTAAYLSFASHYLLEALFGKEAAELILQEEYKGWLKSNKYTFFSKEEMQKMVLSHPKLASIFPSLEPYLNYSKRPMPRNQIGGRDKKTGIGIEKSLIVR